MREEQTVKDLIAQLIVARAGSNLPPMRSVEEYESEIANLIDQYQLGGLVLFNGYWPETPATLTRLQSRSKHLLLITADIERGTGQQLIGRSLFPDSMAFGALGDVATERVEEFAYLTALEARACGVHCAFAPVADVNVDPRNPVISTRAFGDDPEQVSELVTAYIRGAQRGGMLSTAKHFPGHGNTHQDSHDSMPEVGDSRNALERCELAPFRAAIEAGVELIMTAHVAYPALDPTGTPATLSHPILTSLLRDEMGFEGVVCSDSLLMAGVRDRYEHEGDLAEAAILAGVDLLLDVNDIPLVIEHLARAVDAGRLPGERIEEAHSRLVALRKRIAATEPGDVPPVSDQRALEIARETIQPVSDGDPFDTSPLDVNKKTLLIVAKTRVPFANDPAHILKEEMQQAFTDVDYQELLPESTDEDRKRLRTQAAQATQVVVVLIVKPAAWHRFGLLPEQQQVIADIVADRPEQTVVVSLGSPYALDDFPQAAMRLNVWSDVPASQIALVEHLAGK